MICDQAHVIYYPANIKTTKPTRIYFQMSVLFDIAQSNLQKALIVTRSTRSSATLTASSQSVCSTEDDAEQGDVQNLKVHLIGIDSCPQEEAHSLNR